MESLCHESDDIISFDLTQPGVSPSSAINIGESINVGYVSGPFRIVHVAYLIFLAITILPLSIGPSIGRHNQFDLKRRHPEAEIFHRMPIRFRSRPIMSAYRWNNYKCNRIDCGYRCGCFRVVGSLCSLSHYIISRVCSSHIVRFSVVAPSLDFLLKIPLCLRFFRFERRRRRILNEIANYIASKGDFYRFILSSLELREFGQVEVRREIKSSSGVSGSMIFEFLYRIIL